MDNPQKQMLAVLLVQKVGCQHRDIAIVCAASDMSTIQPLGTALTATRAPQVLQECTAVGPHTPELLQDVARVYAKTARGDPSEHLTCIPYVLRKQPGTMICAAMCSIAIDAGTACGEPPS